MLMFLVIPNWLSSSCVKDPVKHGSWLVMISMVSCNGGICV